MPSFGDYEPPKNDPGGSVIPGFSGSSSAAASSDPYYNSGSTQSGGGFRGSVVNNFALDGGRVDSAIGLGNNLWLWLAAGAAALGLLWWFFKRRKQ